METIILRHRFYWIIALLALSSSVNAAVTYQWICEQPDCNGDQLFSSTMTISDAAYAAGDFTGVAGNVLSWDTTSGVGDGFSLGLADIASSLQDDINLRIVLTPDRSKINDLFDVSQGTNISFDSPEGRVDFFEGSLLNYSVGALRDGPIGSEFSDIIIQGYFQVVPVPAAVWLFGTALIGLVGFSKRKKAA